MATGARGRSSSPASSSRSSTCSRSATGSAATSATSSSTARRSSTRRSSRRRCSPRRRSTARSTTRRNIFWKLRYQKVYDAVLATPLGPKDVAVGETVVRALPRPASTRSASSPSIARARAGRVVVGAPRAAGDACFIGFAFAGAGIAAVTLHAAAGRTSTSSTWRSLPMFLFSATFFPLSTYPDWLEWVIQGTPLYHGVDCCGAHDRRRSEQLVNVAYLASRLVGMDREPRVEKLLLSEVLTSGARRLRAGCGRSRRCGASNAAGIRETERSGNIDDESRLPRLRLSRLAAEPDAVTAASPRVRSARIAGGTVVPIRLTPPK